MTMTLTERNAILSQYAAGIYDPAPLGEPLRVSPPSTTGFYAAAYYNETLGKVVVVFRGVDGPNDTGSAIALVTGQWHPQFDEAADFVKGVSLSLYGDDSPQTLERLKTDILVTGHSQGGAISQLMGRMLGLDGATFDPAGAYRQSLLPEFAIAAARLGIDPNANRIAETFRNYPVDGSEVPNSTGEHIGESRLLPPFATPGVADVLKGVFLGWATSNPVMAVLTIAVIDQFGYKHPSGNIQAAMQRLAKLEADAILNPNGGEAVIIKTADGVYVVKNGEGQPVGTVAFRDGKLYLEASTGESLVIGEQGLESFSGVQDTGFQTLINSVQNYGPALIDALSLIRAIQGVRKRCQDEVPPISRTPT